MGVSLRRRAESCSPLLIQLCHAALSAEKFATESHSHSRPAKHTDIESFGQVCLFNGFLESSRSIARMRMCVLGQGGRATGRCHRPFLRTHSNGVFAFLGSISAKERQRHISFSDLMICSIYNTSGVADDTALSSQASRSNLFRLLSKTQTTARSKSDRSVSLRHTHATLPCTSPLRKYGKKDVGTACDRHGTRVDRVLKQADGYGSTNQNLPSQGVLRDALCQLLESSLAMGLFGRTFWVRWRHVDAEATFRRFDIAFTRFR